MIIQAATVGLASSYSMSVSRERTQTTKAWVGDQRPDFEGVNTSRSQGVTPQAARLRLSDASRAALEASKAKMLAGGVGSSTGAPAVVAEDGSEVQLSPKDEQKVRMIEQLLSQMLGYDVKLSMFDGRKLKGSPEASPTNSPQGSGPTSTGTPSGRVGWGIEVSTQETETRTETSTFSGQGLVHTADGKDISFSVGLAMSKTSVQQSSSQTLMGDAVRKDPLVLNFAGTAADLTNHKFSFDLEGDGKTESVNFATGNSAFLARDPGNGPIDGRLLFGPTTGDGFGELAAKDGDGNGWIDQADPAWKDLRLWSRDEQGKDQFRTLDQAGVGAIYLGSVATPFDLGGGSVAQTGVWLGEGDGRDGTAGTIQHVDLVA